MSKSILIAALAAGGISSVAILLVAAASDELTQANQQLAPQPESEAEAEPSHNKQPGAADSQADEDHPADSQADKDHPKEAQAKTGAQAPDSQPLNSAFPSPPQLQPAIAFWRRVFWETPKENALLHDRQTFVVWQEIKLPKNSAGKVNSRASKKTLKRATASLQRRLRRLAKQSIPQDDYDRSILEKVNEPKQLLAAASQIRMQTGIAEQFKAGVERARKWLPQVRAILIEENVPVQLAALPFVESGYNPRARSFAGAAGLWQFMPATAKQYGLRVGHKNDERLQLLKSTQAAAKMLRQNYDMLGTWPLAITGYNHGPYGLKRAVKKHDSDDLVYLINNYHKSTWGFASKNFYAEFVAALGLMNEHLPQDSQTQP